MKKIWIVAPFTDIYTLDTRDRFLYIANELSKNIGYEVHLFTSDFIHLKKEFINISIENNYSFNIYLIHEKGYKKNISLSRAISHVSFAFNLMKKVKEMEKPDLIYCAYPMMTSTYLTGKYAKKNKIPFIIDIQDTWPESISSGINTDNIFIKTLMLPFTMYANKIYKLADLVFGVSQTYANRAKVKGVLAKEFIPVYIGAEGNKFDNIVKLEEKREGEIWCIYIGTLSYSYDLLTLILTFNDLKEINPNIKLYILGNGPDFSILKNRAEKLGLLNKTVYLKGFLPYEEVVRYLKSSDIALNAIKSKALQTMTNKFGDFVSAGLPILNCCQMEEIKRVVIEKKIGVNYIPEDKESLKDSILFLLKNKDKLQKFSKNSKEFADEKFDRRKSYYIILKKIKEILE